jgi:hypothetical protein
MAVFEAGKLVTDPALRGAALAGDRLALRAAFEAQAAAHGLTLDALLVEYILARVGEGADRATLAELGPPAQREDLMRQTPLFRELLAFNLAELAVLEQDSGGRDGAPVH